MTQSNVERTGKVQTVLGMVDPASLGITHTHEHIFMNGTGPYFVVHPDYPERAEEPVSIKNRWWVEHNCNNCRDNIRFESVEEAADEVRLFQEAGGGTLVDVTNVGLGRSPEKLRALAQLTGLNLVMGGGWYVQPSHPADVAGLTDVEMAERIVRDVQDGVDGTDIKVGLLGEVGVSVPFHDDEKKSLRAAVMAQQQTGVPISIHPGMDDDVLLEIVEVLRAAGVDFENVIMGHLDSFGYSRETRLKVAETGCFLEFDCFGYTNFMNTETLGSAHGLPHPSDSERIDDISFFIKEGYGKKIVLSQDVFYKHVRATYGGHGYSHILRNMVPMMKSLGFTREELDDLLIHNPQRALTFAAPR